MKKLVYNLLLVLSICIFSSSSIIANAAESESQQEVLLSGSKAEEWSVTIPVSLDIMQTTEYKIEADIKELEPHHSVMVYAEDMYTSEEGDISNRVNFQVHNKHNSDFVVGTFNQCVFVFESDMSAGHKEGNVKLQLNKELTAGDWVGEITYNVRLVNNQRIPGVYLRKYEPFEGRTENEVIHDLEMTNLDIDRLAAVKYLSYYDFADNTDKTKYNEFLNYMTEHASEYDICDLILPSSDTDIVEINDEDYEIDDLAKSLGKVFNYVITLENKTTFRYASNDAVPSCVVTDIPKEEFDRIFSTVSGSDSFVVGNDGTHIPYTSVSEWSYFDQCYYFNLQETVTEIYEELSHK